MRERPKVSPKDWICIGNLNAVVCQIYTKNASFDIEVVFLDKDKAVNVSARWNGEGWELDKADLGGYADNYPRLSEYVAILGLDRVFAIINNVSSFSNP